MEPAIREFVSSRFQLDPVRQQPASGARAVHTVIVIHSKRDLLASPYVSGSLGDSARPVRDSGRLFVSLDFVDPWLPRG